MSKRINESHDFGGGPAKIINLPAPTSGGDAATKAYVDALPAGLKFIEDAVRVATTGNINLAAPGATIDGATMALGDRFLAWLQTDATAKGTYIWNGAAAAATRTTDVFESGSVVFTGNDGAAGPIGYILTTDNPIVLGTTSLTFVAAFRVISAGTGLTQTGNVIALTAPVSIALGGTNATTATAALAALGAAIPNEATFGDGTATTFTFGSFKSIKKYPHVKVYLVSTGAEEDCAVTITPGAQSGGVYTPTIVLSSENWAATPPASNTYYVTVVG